MSEESRAILKVTRDYISLLESNIEKMKEKSITPIIQVQT